MYFSNFPGENTRTPSYAVVPTGRRFGPPYVRDRNMKLLPAVPLSKIRKTAPDFDGAQNYRMMAELP